MFMLELMSRFGYEIVLTFLKKYVEKERIEGNAMLSTAGLPGELLNEIA